MNYKYVYTQPSKLRALKHDDLGFSDTLCHAKKGEEVAGHKYTSREWKNGSWVYNYGDEGSADKQKDTSSNRSESAQEAKNRNFNASMDKSIDKAKQIQDNAQFTRDITYEKLQKEYKNGYIDSKKGEVSYNHVKFELMTAVKTVWHEVQIKAENLKNNRPGNLNSPQGAQWLKDYNDYRKMVEEAEDFQKFADDMFAEVANLQNRNGSKVLGSFDRDSASFNFNDNNDIPMDEFEFNYITEIKKYSPLNSEYKHIFSRQ